MHHLADFSYLLYSELINVGEYMVHLMCLRLLRITFKNSKEKIADQVNTFAMDVKAAHALY